MNQRWERHTDCEVLMVQRKTTCRWYEFGRARVFTNGTTRCAVYNFVPMAAFEWAGRLSSLEEAKAVVEQHALAKAGGK